MSNNNPQHDLTSHLSALQLAADEGPTDLPSGPEAAYSHEAAVAAISAFYEVVARGHVEGKLMYPPIGGWPSMRTEPDDNVTKLLRHLPYFFDVCEEVFFVIPETTSMNYASFWCDYEDALTPKAPPTQVSESLAVDANDDPEQIPPHIIQIMAGHGRYGYDVYIDTERGAVICHRRDGEEPEDGEEGDLDDLDWPYNEEVIAHIEKYKKTCESDPLEWRRAPTYRIETFFKIYTQKFLDCEWTVEVERTSVHTCGPERSRIMKDCGWPDEHWDKARAKREIEARIQEAGCID